jgi:hypothetical protein
MSYMRGEPYIWTDGEYTYIWSNQESEGENDHYPSRVRIKNDQLEELAVMVISRMSLQEIEEAKNRAIQNNEGNSGCMVLMDERNQEK